MKGILLISVMLSVFGGAYAAESPLLRDLRGSKSAAAGKVQKVTLVGTKLIIEYAAPRVEIPLLDVECTGSDMMTLFFIKCREGDCMRGTSYGGQAMASPIESYELEGKSSKTAQACVQLQDSLRKAK